jgi:hypothetical protein
MLKDLGAQPIVSFKFNPGNSKFHFISPKKNPINANGIAKMV